MRKIVFLDTETTGLEGEPGMIQLGYIVCNEHFQEEKRVNLFFSTDKDIEVGAMATHHITPMILAEKLEDDPRSNEEKLKEARADLEGAFIIAHNSPFDKKILDCNGLITDDNQWIDSYNIAYRAIDEDGMRYNLQYLRYYLGCVFEEEINPHDALSDVIVLKEVFECLLSIFENSLTVDMPRQDILSKFVEYTLGGIILREWTFGKYKGQKVADTAKSDLGYLQWMYNAKINDGNTDDHMFNTLKHYLGK